MSLSGRASSSRSAPAGPPPTITTFEDFAAAGYDGEFAAIYVLRTDQRRGVGKRLMTAMMSDLGDSGLGGFTLWVPRDNIPARSLYEQLGGKLIGQREDTRDQGTLMEVAYGWPKPPSVPEV